MVPMDIQINSSDPVKDKINKLIRNTSINMTKDAKVILVERGYDTEENKICIVFDPIDYDEVIELLQDDAPIINVDDHTITGFSNNRYSIIDMSDILYIEAQGAQVSCYTTENEFSVKKTLSFYENELKAQGIVRINKSQLVNMRNVKEIIPWFNSRLVFVLENEKELEVSKLYSKAIRKLLNI